MSTSLLPLCSHTLLSTIVLSGEYWTPFFSPCTRHPYSLLFEALQNSAWGLRYPLWRWQSENQFNWKNQRCKNRTPFFLTLRLAPLFLFVGWFAGMGVAVPNSAWGLRYPLWNGHSRNFNWKNQSWRRIVKSWPPFFSYLVLGITVTVCCWLCGNESGGGKFSPRAEIFTGVRT